MAIRLTPTNALIVGVLFLISGVAMIASGEVTLVSVVFCATGVLTVIGGIVRAVAGSEVASKKLQQRRRERFGSKR